VISSHPENGPFSNPNTLKFFQDKIFGKLVNLPQRQIVPNKPTIEQYRKD